MTSTNTTNGSNMSLETKLAAYSRVTGSNYVNFQFTAPSGEWTMRMSTGVVGKTLEVKGKSIPDLLNNMDKEMAALGKELLDVSSITP